jgi:hypothetical protein
MDAKSFITLGAGWTIMKLFFHGNTLFWQNNFSWHRYSQHNDTQHNNIQPNSTQHTGLIAAIL